MATLCSPNRTRTRRQPRVSTYGLNLFLPPVFRFVFYFESRHESILQTSSELHSLELVGLRRPWRLAQVSLRRLGELHGPDLLMALIHPRLPAPVGTFSNSVVELIFCIRLSHCSVVSRTVDLSLYLMQRLVLISHGPGGDTHKFWQPLLELVQAPWLPALLRLKVIRCVLSLLMCEAHQPAITSAVVAGLPHSPFVASPSPSASSLPPSSASASSGLPPSQPRVARSHSGSSSTLPSSTSSSASSSRRVHADSTSSRPQGVTGVKASFREARGLLITVQVLASLPLHEADMASSLFMLLAEAVANCDANKV